VDDGAWAKVKVLGYKLCDPVVGDGTGAKGLN
jgi:hypothetical protein